MGAIPESEDELLDECRDALEDKLDRTKLSQIDDVPHFIRSEIRRFFREATGRKPNVMAFVN